jgi:hypothetical protein
MACISPGFWLLLPAVILLESVVAFIVLRKGLWFALKISTLANVISTLAGMLLNRLLSIILQPVANSASHYLPNNNNLFQGFAITAVLAPFGLTSNHAWWSSQVVLCWILLLVPFFLLSVWLEAWVARKVLKKDERLATRWSWCANIASYALIIGLFWRIFGLTWWWLER